jgi:hypothetical protein
VKSLQDLEDMGHMFCKGIAVDQDVVQLCGADDIQLPLQGIVHEKLEVEGAFERLNGMTLYLKRPYCVWNPVFHSSPFAILI